MASADTNIVLICRVLVVAATLPCISSDGLHEKPVAKEAANLFERGCRVDINPEMATAQVCPLVATTGEELPEHGRGSQSQDGSGMLSRPNNGIGGNETTGSATNGRGRNASEHRPRSCRRAASPTPRLDPGPIGVALTNCKERQRPEAALSLRGR